MQPQTKQPPLLVGITGASGVIYGARALQALRQAGRPAHLILSPAARLNFGIETDLDPDEVCSWADRVHEVHDLAAPPASGSFRTGGMLVAPCSMKTLSAIANSYSDNLLVRAADVTLKERRPLVLMVRETPLHLGHLELMQQAARLGAVILPPVPAFYHRPQTIDDLIDQSVGKALDILGVEHQLFSRWQGWPPDGKQAP